MNAIRLGALSLCLGACTVAAPAVAAEQTYTYSIVHPTFGDIGVFTDRIEHTGDQMSIHTQLRIAVRMVGVVVYREQADGVEVLQGRRLVALENVGDKDGKNFNVHGRIEGGRFMVNSPAGSFAAPLDVLPSDPWLVHGATQGKVLSTRTGQVVDVTVTGGEPVSIEVQGSWVRARHYIVNGDKRQEIWMADNSVPVMFRSFEDGMPIDFVLKTPLSQAVPGYVAAVPPPGPTAMNVSRDRGGN